MKERTVAVVGLGYVGLPIAVAFGKHHRTIGFDINKAKIEELQKGFDRTGEVSAADLNVIPSPIHRTARRSQIC